MFENEQIQERALLVALDTGEYDAETSLAELGELTQTAGAEPAFTLTQKRPRQRLPPVSAPAWRQKQQS